MPSGDAQRVWFPEMIEELKRFWTRNVSWEELAELCQNMTEVRKELRRERGILPPKTRCPHCGEESRSDIAGVSVRSALFVLKNAGVITESEFEDLDKSWMKHKRRNRLDGYGRQADKRASKCGESQTPTTSSTSIKR